MSCSDVTDGTLYISDDNNDYTVKTGEYVITPPCKNQHGWKNCECTFYYFHWFADAACDDIGNYTCEDTRLGDFPSFGSYRNIDIIEKYYTLLNDTGLLQRSFPITSWQSSCWKSKRAIKISPPEIPRFCAGESSHTYSLPLARS